MQDQDFRFDDGAAYERMMGDWSRRVGEIFLDWLSLPAGLRWLDIGCGNGAFTEVVVDRCTPAEVHGIDPSEGQLVFARARPAARMAEFLRGDAMALPFPADRFDAAIMALVVFFLPDPAKGVSEMRRVICPGGTVAAYAWDLLGGGLPLEPIHAAMRAMGFALQSPSSCSASQVAALQELWNEARFEELETREITVQRCFASFEEYWTTSTTGTNLGRIVAAISPSDLTSLKARVQDRLPADATGRITCLARANAIKGRRSKRSLPGGASRGAIDG
jgi:ubiquinone/menaquinone biosynthesis C-methylase UbiE